MLNSFEISLIIILVVAILGLIFLNFRNRQWVETSEQASRYNSFNVPEGHSATLQCPVGYEINLNKVFVGTGPPPGSDSSDIEQCYSKMNKVVGSGNGGMFGCKIATQVSGANNPTGVTDNTIKDKCNGQSLCKLSDSDLSQVISSANRDCKAETDGLCVPYVFGVYECIKQ